MADKEDDLKTEEMDRYEKETGKKSIWGGTITEGFKKWQKGDKIPKTERITIKVSEDTKNEWQIFAEKNRIPTISQLIRDAVNYYLDEKQQGYSSEELSELSHKIKESLTSIKGFSQLIEASPEKPSIKILEKVKKIYDQAENIEHELNIFLGNSESDNYDVLIVEDDDDTIDVLVEFFDLKGYSAKGVATGNEGLKELEEIKPKLILLDIILPDISGYEVCKVIRKQEKLKRVPVFYISAVPESEVMKRLKETGAEGFLPKPFDLTKFEDLFPL